MYVIIFSVAFLTRLFYSFLSTMQWKLSTVHCPLSRALIGSFLSSIRVLPVCVVQKVDNAIHLINHFPADSMVCFVNTYPLDSNLSGG